jgi:hypothetical protein
MACSTTSLSDRISSRGGVRLQRASLYPPPPAVHVADPVGAPPLSPVLAREDHALTVSTLAAVVGAGPAARWRPGVVEACSDALEA